jgi:hypothetical protein
MPGTGIRLNSKAEPCPAFGCILYISKIRYGTQLLGKIRWNEEDPKKLI